MGFYKHLLWVLPLTVIVSCGQKSNLNSTAASSSSSADQAINAGGLSPAEVSTLNSLSGEEFVGAYQLACEKKPINPPADPVNPPANPPATPATVNGKIDKAAGALRRNFNVQCTADNKATQLDIRNAALVRLQTHLASLQDGSFVAKKQAEIEKLKADLAAATDPKIQKRLQSRINHEEQKITPEKINAKIDKLQNTEIPELQQKITDCTNA